MSTIRKLSEKEIKILSEIYGKSINFDKVKLTRKHLFSFLLKKFTAVTFGNKIVYSRKKYEEDFSDKNYAMSILVHEICHVWQHQNLKYHWTKAMIEQIRYRKKVYKYSIYDFKNFINFRFEQQAEIMADYFRKKKSDSDEIRLYQKIISPIFKNT